MLRDGPSRWGSDRGRPPAGSETPDARQPMVTSSVSPQFRRRCLLLVRVGIANPKIQANELLVLDHLRVPALSNDISRAVFLSDIILVDGRGRRGANPGGRASNGFR
jgi:hypothetical protein